MYIISASLTLRQPSSTHDRTSDSGLVSTSWPVCYFRDSGHVIFPNNPGVYHAQHVGLPYSHTYRRPKFGPE
jgi:hypothetical protein